MIKKIEHFLKEYFVFSNTERKGIILLLLLLLGLIIAPYMYEWINPPRPINISISDLPAENEEVPATSVAEKRSLSVFDPNTATDEQLGALGFTTKNIATIKNYLAKGGQFRKPADLANIYGIREELYLSVEPFIRIQKNENAPLHRFDSLKQKRPARVVELNTADSGEIVSLYRIGPALTHRILEQRSRLGGFVSLAQLKEIWGFDEDLLYDLAGKVKVDASRAKIFNVNTVTVEELRSHPYFKYKLSGAIVNYRMQHGPFQSMEDLKKIVLVNDSVYQRITTYLKIN